MDKIVFSQLSWPLKIAVIISYAVCAIWLLLFLAGFLAGATA